VETADEMHKAVIEHAKKCSVVIMSAAVADYTPRKAAVNKIKKGKKASGLTVDLRPTSDILQDLGTRNNGTVLVGFALETEDEVKNAKEKLKKKNLDLIILNSTRDEGAAFGSDTNVITIISKDGKTEKLPRMPKFDVAVEILNRVARLL
jgi:phosphopantothenoylcysteine decarboxylase/phosphopantothenate--cysteine ligase